MGPDPRTGSSPDTEDPRKKTASIFQADVTPRSGKPFTARIWRFMTASLLNDGRRFHVNFAPWPLGRR